MYPKASSEAVIAAGTFELKQPIFVVGYGARIPYDKPKEKLPRIEYLIERFFADGGPDQIPNPKSPYTQFGIVGEYDPATGQGLYLMGLQVTSLAQIPDEMRGFTIPTGLYAQIRVQAPTQEVLTATAIHEGYHYLYETWLPASPYRKAEWLTVEAYFEDRFDFPVDPQMEIWIPIEPK